MAGSGRATKLAQSRTKAYGAQPSYRLMLNDKPVYSNLYDCTVTYSSDGTSDLSLSTDFDLARHVGDKVELYLGYGDELWPYFGGWIEEPQDDHWGGASTADAYGPFKELAETSLQDDITYSSHTLGYAIADLHNKAKLRGSTFEVMGDSSFNLSGEESGIAISTSIMDGINSLLELAGWVSQDRPQFRRRYRPAPRPTPSGEITASYTESHFPPGAFKATRGKPYGTVGAYSRNDTTGAINWGGAVLVTVDSNVNPLKTYWLNDFVGDEQSALNECGKLASLLSNGVYAWTLEGISANPDLELHDIIRVRTTELRGEGGEGGRFRKRYEVEYACAIDNEITVNVSTEGHPMTLSGSTAIKLSERKIDSPFSHSPAGSAVVS